MASYTVYGISGNNLSINGGSGSLSGINQGSGAHLAGAEIVITDGNLEAISLTDNDGDFEDSDTSQRLDGDQEFFGETYGDNRVLEAEYELTVEDPDGNEYTLIGVNVREPGASNSYGTVEGIAFVGDVPPANMPLKVIKTSEGPKGGDTAYDSYAAPCFAAGTLIETEEGPRRVETLERGDRVMTLDQGLQPLVWVGHVQGRAKDFPVRIEAGALGSGPVEDLLVSPQHRVFLKSDLAGIWFNAAECLVAAKSLVGRPGCGLGDGPVRYTHLMLERHQILFANGAATESLLPGPEALKGLGLAERMSLARLLPELPDVMIPARPILRGWEARLVAS